MDFASMDTAFALDEAFALEGQKAIITGGGTGIGEASAKVLASRGCDVVVASRKVDNCERVAAEIIAATGRRATAMALDVRDDASCTATMEAAIDTLGGCDILVNNAGGSYMYPFLETGMDRFDNNMSLNLRGPYHLIQLVAPTMIAGTGGRIVNISSQAGVQGVRGGAVYSASKAGLQMLTRVVASELGPKGIRCNAIAVGAVASEGALRAWDRFGMTAESAGANTPLRRVGHPLDIAMGVFFFCSELSSWISGQTLSIDGGPAIGGGLPDAD